MKRLAVLIGLLLTLTTVGFETRMAQAGSCVCSDKQDACQVLTSASTESCDLVCRSSLGAAFGSSAYSEPTTAGAEQLKSACAAATEKAGEKTVEQGTYQKPVLGVNIPTISFSDATKDGRFLKINFLAEYVTGAYRFMLSVGFTIAVIILMVGGFQYVLHWDVAKAKKRMTEALIGLVLLMSVTILLYAVNPQLILFKPLSIEHIDELRLSTATDGEEGGGTRSNNLSDLPAQCKDVVTEAKTEGKCDMTNGAKFSSPTGKGPNCGKHHWQDGGAEWDYKKITNLDYAAGWGQAIIAPFDGVVTYAKQTDATNRCGNRIYLKGSGADITICHAKDFLDGSNSYQGAHVVKAGDVLGHIGGNCCQGENPPGDWAAAKGGWCKKPGPACSDPTKAESCNCQPIEQAGNTSGPHVHVTWNPVGGNLLACLAD